MGADFKIVKEQPAGRNNVVVYHLAGWLDAQSEQQVVNAIQQAKDDGKDFVLLDLKDVDTITSAGIRAMQKGFQLLTPKADTYKVAHLKLCNAPAQIYQVLSITGILMNVPMFENQDDAVESFGK